jgi:hypothetical protein
MPKEVTKVRVTKLIASFGLLIGMQSALWAAPFGFSVSDTTNRLYRIDLATGVATDLGQLNYPQDDELEGLASRGGTLFGVGEANYGPGGLYNITTPPGTLIGQTGVRFGTEAGAAFNPLTDVLYNIQGDDLSDIGTRSALYVINPLTAASGLVGTSSIYADGLAINSNGEAFATDFRLSGSLYRVNLATGALSLVGSLGLGAGGTGFDSGLAFDLDTGILYAIREDGAIYTLSTTTGAATFRAFVTLPNGTRVPGDLEGLDIPRPAQATAVPEPATMLLLGTGTSRGSG